MADLRGRTGYAVCGASSYLAPMEKRRGGKIHMNAGSLRFGIAAVLMLATALVLQAHSRSEFFPPRESLSSLPAQIDGWNGTDSVLDQDTLDILGPGEFLVRHYENTRRPALPPISLYIAYFPTQKAEPGNWCCTGFRLTAARWPASIGPSIIWCPIRFA